MHVAVDATFTVVYLNSFKANSVAASLLQSRFAIQVQATSSTVFKSNRKSIKAQTVEGLGLDGLPVGFEDRGGSCLHLYSKP